MSKTAAPTTLIALQDLSIAQWATIPQGAGRYGNNNLKRAKTRSYFMTTLQTICPDASQLETAQMWAQVVDMAELLHLAEDN